MSYILKNASIYYNNKFINSDLLIDDNGNLNIADSIDIDVDEIIDLYSCHIFPSFINILSNNNDFKGGYSNFFKQEKNLLKEENNKLASFDIDSDLVYITKNHSPNTYSVIYGEFNEILNNFTKKDENTSFAVNVDNIEEYKILSEYINNNIIEIIYSNNINHIFSILYTNLVKEKLISLNKLLDLISFNIGDIFGFNIGEIINFKKANICVYDLNRSYKYNNKYIYGKCLLTIKNGKIVHRDSSI